MPNCTQQSFSFPALKRRKFEAEFSGDYIASEGDVLLLRQVDKRLGLLAVSDKVLQESSDHFKLRLLRQLVYSICPGYEKLNDQKQLR